VAKALKINNRDNCAVLLADAKAGETVEVQTETGIVHLDARHDIALGHKIALIKLDADQPIIKYSEEIGRAMAAIEAGDWIHLHNTYCRCGHDHQEQ
jgi:altronate dehydratase small subunit